MESDVVTIAEFFQFIAHVPEEQAVFVEVHFQTTFEQPKNQPGTTHRYHALHHTPVNLDYCNAVSHRHSDQTYSTGRTPFSHETHFNHATRNSAWHTDIDCLQYSDTVGSAHKNLLHKSQTIIFPNLTCTKPRPVTQM